MSGLYLGFIVITGIFSFIGMIVSNRLKSKFSQYSQMPLRNGMSGREVAEAMLRHYGIRDVQIVEGKGFLTDHYNPMKKVVSLSPNVYRGRHISAAAVAAHECGHAVQHDKSYTWLKFRSAMVPLVSVASRAQQFLMMLAIGALGVSNNTTLLTITVATFLVTALFSFITLPVEFDASNRALAWLDSSGVLGGAEYEGAKDALKWAAMTYVVAALSALVILLYLLMKLSAARRN